uniref:K Homology domain-containing protein n=1 Tax=Lactuca sativa TaxID=4236 RepID=A0A9R1W1X5_LACSA|nr:hypothetical protein LSAT_V11C300132510 [Lactuca sativa]
MPLLLSQFKITKRDGVCHFVFSFSLKFVFLPLYVNLFAELYVLKRRMELYALKVVIIPINRSKKKGEELYTPTFFTCLANEYERRHMSASSIARLFNKVICTGNTTKVFAYEETPTPNLTFPCLPNLETLLFKTSIAFLDASAQIQCGILEHLVSRFDILNSLYRVTILLKGLMNQILMIRTTTTELNDMKSEREVIRSFAGDVHSILHHLLEAHDPIITITICTHLAEKLRPALDILSRIEGVPVTGVQPKQGGNKVAKTQPPPEPKPTAEPKINEASIFEKLKAKFLYVYVMISNLSLKMIGLIIGKGGETIKNMHTRSGARIQSNVKASRVLIATRSEGTNAREFHNQNQGLLCKL